MENGVRIIKRLAQLRSLRQKHEQVWADCFAYTFPLRADGFYQSLDAVTGQAERAKMLDSTAADAAVTLASAKVSGITPANSRWFGLLVGQDTDEERAWLDEAAHTLWENIHASNFDAVSFECMIDDVCAGWFVLYIDTDRQRGGFMFEQWALHQCFIASSVPGGKIDTIFREYLLTASQAVKEYGASRLSDKIVKLAKDKPDEPVKFVHAIEPRENAAQGASRSKMLPFASYKVEMDSGRVVVESGYHEFPCAVPRWMMIPNSCYAVGKVYDALPDIKELNELEYLNKAALDMAVSGMWIAEDDGVLNPRSIKIGPRKVIIANSVDSVKELKSGGDVQTGWVAKEALQNAIRKTMMADQLSPRDGPALTATEVHANQMLLRQLMGPTFGRMQPEYLQTMVERCFGLAYRAGVLGRAPDSLANREYSVKYLSPLARAQQLEDVTAMDRFETTLLTKAEIKPEVLDLYDWEGADRLRSELLGVPARLLLSSDDVEQIREGRAKAKQAQQAQAMAEPMLQEAGKAVVQRMAA